MRLTQFLPDFSLNAARRRLDFTAAIDDAPEKPPIDLDNPAEDAADEEAVVLSLSQPIQRESSSGSLISQSSQHDWNLTFDISSQALDFNADDNPFKSSSQSTTRTTVSSEGSLVGSSLLSFKRGAGSWETEITTESESLESPTRSAKRRKISTTDQPSSQSNEEPVLVGFSAPHVNYMHPLAFGVQWEIARLASSKPGFWSDVHIPEMVSLRGKTNEVAAPDLACKLKTRAAVAKSKSADLFDQTERAAQKGAWAELDKEEAKLAADKFAGLGCSGPDGWYGGRVQFTARILVAKSGEISLGLDEPTLGPSNRFARRFGSSCLLRVRLKKKLPVDESKLEEYFKRPFIVATFVYRAFYAKEGNVFLLRTNESLRGLVDVSSKPASIRSAVRPGPDLEEFLRWHNPPELNDSQAMRKWAARFALGLSTSVPGVRIQPQNVHFIPDIELLYPPGMKIPSELCMTDGCGFINRAGIKAIARALGWDFEPVAVQFRFLGAKGLLLLHPDDLGGSMGGEPTVWLRESQIKIKYGSLQDIDPAMLILDVVRPARIQYPTQLAKEMITNLAENGVPTSTFEKILGDSMQEQFEDLTAFETDAERVWLWKTVDKLGGGPMRSTTIGDARAKGLTFMEEEDEDESEDAEDTVTEDPLLGGHSKAWATDLISGCPVRIEETFCKLLESGFIPSENAFMMDKLRAIVEKALNKFVLRYKVEIPKSAVAFIVPDPFDVLEEGQIHFAVSAEVLDQNDSPTHVITGDVLVGRYPCKVPTDIQKRKAVAHLALARYVNVIVFSTKGKRSDASLLGGGDYDGDTVNIIWDPEITGAFKNAPLHFADPPKGIRDSFEAENETVSELLGRTSTSGFIHGAYKYLLAGISGRAIVGIYSNWHENAVYRLGYGHEETQRLAAMFCYCLDAVKTGLVIKKSVLDKDRKRWNIDGPRWKYSDDEAAEIKARSSSTNPFLRRKTGLGHFVIEQLQKVAINFSTTHKTSLAAMATSVSTRADETLQRPWKEFLGHAQMAERQCREDSAVKASKQIEDHVKATRGKYRRNVMPLLSPSKTKPITKPISKSASRADVAHVIQRQDSMRSISHLFVHDLGTTAAYLPNLNQLKASCAYTMDFEEHPWGTRFPYDVAFRDLCGIKAQASRDWRVVSAPFTDFLSIRPPKSARPVRNRGS